MTRGTMVDNAKPRSASRALLHTALNESEEQFRALFETASVGMAQAEPQTGRFLRVNQKFCAITGYREEELLKLRITDITHPEDRQSDWELFQRVVRGDVPSYRMEKRYVRKDGAVVWVNVNATVIRDAAGRPMRTVGIIEDITERKQAEATLRLQTAALAAAANAIVITDRHGAIEWANPAFTALTGYTVAEAAGRNPRDLVKSGRHPASFFQELWETILAGRVWRSELVNRRKDGTHYTEEMTITPVLDTSGEVAHFIAVKSDITERKRAEEARALFRSLVDQSNDAIEVIDPATGRFLDVNERECADLGYSREELLSLKVFDIDPVLDPLSFPMHIATLRKSGSMQWNGVHRRKDGSTFSVEVGLRYVRGDRDYLVAVVRDITERKKTEEALQRLNETLEQRMAERTVALRESEERFRVMFESHGAPMLLIEPDSGRITDANEAAARFYGYSREQLRAMCIEQINQLPPEEIAAERRAAVEQRRNVFFFPHRLASGEVRAVEVYSSPVKIQGRPLLFSIIHDITERKRAEEELTVHREHLEELVQERTKALEAEIAERKQAEEALRESEERFRLLVASSMDAVLLATLDGRILSANEAACRMFGWSEAELMQMGRGDLVDPSETHLTLLLEERARKGRYRGELTHVRKDGTKFPGEVSSVIFTDRHGEARANTTIRDITMRKRAEEQLRSLSRQLLRAEDEERRRIAKELHDSTAQDLVAVMMSFDSLRERMAEKDEKLAGQIEDGLAVLEKCAHDIRTLAYVLHPPRLNETGLDASIRQYATGFGERTGIAMTLALQHGLGRLNADVELVLFRVLQESLANIYRHAKSPTAAVSLARRGGETVLEVRDAGGGMPRAIAEAKDGFVPGLGVGIAGMRERLRQIGGSLEIESNSQGTTVRAIVPESQDTK